jgi:hypothetical protein
VQFTFTINVTAERSEGKFASRDEIGDAILDELEGADPSTVDGEAGGVYEITEWEVSLEEPVKPAKRKRA